MIKEDLIHQVASEISHRLLAGSASSQITPSDWATKGERPLIIFCQDANEAVRAAVSVACPNAQALTANSLIGANKTPDTGDFTVLALVAPSLDLAAKIALLQTDSALADLVVRALYADKRVIAVMAGMLAPPPDKHSGIFRAIAELREKLAGLGIEMVAVEALSSALTAQTTTRKSPVAAPPAAQSQPSQPLSSRLPVLNAVPFSQHPSQERIHLNDTLNEFVEFLQTKQCTMEKGKPCDQCDICNTLGF
jgi:hypothetical protein